MGHCEYFSLGYTVKNFLFLQKENMAKDIFHDMVKIALEMEGWVITHDPYTINIPDFKPKQDIDLGTVRRCD